MSWIDEAAAALRQHLHERPYRDNPGQVYADLGALAELLIFVQSIAASMGDAAGKATGTDDGNLHVVEGRTLIAVAHASAAEAWLAADAACEHVSHLTFGGDK